MKCQLCGKPHQSFGTLIDPNGHRWRMCANCINSLWEEKQEMNQDDRAKEWAVDTILAILREKLLS